MTRCYAFVLGYYMWVRRVTLAVEDHRASQPAQLLPQQYYVTVKNS